MLNPKKHKIFTLFVVSFYWLRRKVQTALITVLEFASGSRHNNKLESKVFCFVNLINALANIGGAVPLLAIGQYFNAFVHLFTSLVFISCWFMASRYINYKYLYWPMLLSIAVFLTLTWVLDNGPKGGSHYYWIAAIAVAVVTAPNYIHMTLATVLICILTYLLFTVNIISSETIYYRMVERDPFDVAHNYLFVQILIFVFTVLLMLNLGKERKKTENILVNLLPKKILEELREYQRVKPKHYKSASIIFTDFVGFSRLSLTIPARVLIEKLNEYFSVFDEIIAKHGLEKIKTLGDGYLAVGGIPTENETHAADCVKAAIEIIQFIYKEKKQAMSENRHYFDIRIGINTGPLIAGVVGVDKLNYDVWGESVNLASRMESNGKESHINVSRSTYELTKEFFDYECSGQIYAKNIGDVDVYVLKGLKAGLTARKG